MGCPYSTLNQLPFLDHPIDSAATMQLGSNCQQLLPNATVNSYCQQLLPNCTNYAIALRSSHKFYSYAQTPIACSTEVCPEVYSETHTEIRSCSWQAWEACNAV